jgi:hypothetical protein
MPEPRRGASVHCFHDAHHSLPRNPRLARQYWEAAWHFAQTAQQHGEQVFGIKHPQQMHNRTLVRRLEEKLSNLPGER